MCGLIGAVAKQSYGFYSRDSDIMQQLIYTDSLRGWDATGVFGVTKDNTVDVLKAAIAGGFFAASKEFDEFKKKMIAQYKFVIGHNRKATHGEKNSEQAHPFWSEDNNIVLVHNGMISNHKEFCATSTVDSNAVCNALALEEDPKKVLGKLQGSFALIWYNVKKHKLYFARNDARPLNMVTTSSCIYFSSEEDMATWILKRNSEKVLEVLPVKPWNLFSIDLQKTEVVDEGEIEIIKKHIPSTYTPSQTRRQQTHTGKNTQTCTTNDGINAFYVSTDFNSAKDVFEAFKRDDQTIFIPSTYTERGDMVTIQGSIINVELPYLDVIMNVRGEDFEDLDLTKPILCTIMALVRDAKDENKCKMYLANPVLPQLHAIETASQLFLTEDMYFDDAFDNVCSICDKAITYTKLVDAEVYVSGGKTICNLCKSCQSNTQPEHVH